MLLLMKFLIYDLMMEAGSIIKQMTVQGTEADNQSHTAQETGLIYTNSTIIQFYSHYIPIISPRFYRLSTHEGQFTEAN